MRPPGDSGSAGRPLGSEYTLQEIIGHGSMAEVYRAVNRDGDPFAVKVLRPELGSDAEIVSRFIRERSILIGLNAPNVVRVRDLVAEGGTLAIVMDLVDGPDLRAELLRRRTLPTAVAVELAVGVLRGIEAVHAAGVIHRDIKPENIILKSGRLPGELVPMVTDFGISGLVSPDTGGHRTSVIGTPEYMAPELIDDENPSVASDLYAIGVLLYEMINGAPPFRARTMMALMKMQAQSEPVRPAGVPDAVWAVMARLLSKKPGQRPASAAAVISALERLPVGSLSVKPLTPPGPPVVTSADTVLQSIPTRSRRPAPFPRRAAIFLALGTGVLAAGLAGILILSLSDDDQASPVRADPSPTASGRTLFSDDFERADAAQWGPKWAVGIRPRGGSGDGTHVDEGAGVLETSDLGNYSAEASISMRANLEPITDLEVRFSFFFDETESYPAVLVRANPAVDSVSGYALRFERGEGYGLERRVEGVEKGEQLGFQKFAFEQGKEYSVAFQAVGSKFRVKVWPASASEPTAWGMEVENGGTKGAGSVGLMVGGGKAEKSSNWYVNDFTVRDAH